MSWSSSRFHGNWRLQSLLVTSIYIFVHSTFHSYSGLVLDEQSPFHEIKSSSCLLNFNTSLRSINYVQFAHSNYSRNVLTFTECVNYLVKILITDLEFYCAVKLFTLSFHLDFNVILKLRAQTTLSLVQWTFFGRIKPFSRNQKFLMST